MISRVNKRLLPMKSHYFVYNAATAPVVPFLSVLAKQLGFSGTIVGVIYTILPICGMLAKPIMGAIADRFRIKKLLFIIFQIITAAAILPINYIPEIPTKSDVHFACDNGAAVFDTTRNNKTMDGCILDQIYSEHGANGIVKCKVFCEGSSEKDREIVYKYWLVKGMTEYDADLYFNANIHVDKIEVIHGALYFTVNEVSFESGDGKAICPNPNNTIDIMCDMRCDSAVITDALSVTHLQTMADVAGLSQFWLFFLLAIFAWVGMAVVVSIGDAICFEMLGDQPNLYGNQRLWGSVGWGLFSILAGLMVDHFSSGLARKDYTSAFYLAIAMMALDVIISSRLKYTQQHMSSSIAKDVGRLLTKPRIVVFLFWCVFMGMCTAMLWQFLFWHLEDLAGKVSGCGMNYWIKTLEGLVMGIQCLGGELPFFFLSGWILRRLGHVYCMSLVLLGVGVRFILYSLLTQPWWVLPIELMNGVTFGLFYATMASYASIAAPPGTEATVQGLVGAVFEGVGVSLGSLIGGTFIDRFGTGMAFRLFGVASLVCCVVHFCVQLLMARLGRDDGEGVEASYAHPSEDYEAVGILTDLGDRPGLRLDDH